MKPDLSLMNPYHVQQYLPVAFFRQVGEPLCDDGRRFLNNHWTKGSSPRDVYDLAQLYWLLWVLAAIDKAHPNYLHAYGDFAARSEAFLWEVLDTYYPHSDIAAQELLALYYVGDDGMLHGYAMRNRREYDRLRVMPGQTGEPFRVLYDLATALGYAHRFITEWHHYQHLYDAVFNFMMGSPRVSHAEIRLIWDKHISFDLYRNILEGAFNA